MRRLLWVLGLGVACEPGKADSGAVNTNPRAGVPDLVVVPTAVDMGVLHVATYHEVTVTMLNAGTADLHLEEVSLADSTGPVQWSNLSAIVLPPETFASLKLVAIGETSGDFDNTLSIHSDDPDEPIIVVHITGRIEGS